MVLLNVLLKALVRSPGDGLLFGEFLALTSRQTDVEATSESKKTGFTSSKMANTKFGPPKDGFL